MSLVRGLTEVGAKAVKKTAPFYSAVDEALANLKRPKGTGIEFLTEVLKQPGVKKAEIADRKLEQAFKAKGKMTKEEAQQVLKENPPPKLQERELTEITDDMREAELRDKIETSGYDSWREVPSRVLQRWNEEIDHNMEKYGDYKLPGGKNYREILLKLPKSFSDAESNRLMSLEADLRRGELPTKQMEELVALQIKKQNSQPEYWSTHYLQDPNVLAHMRVQDRVGPNGEKILHVEEIQSDWHQEGRKKGYHSEDKPMRMTGEVVPLGDATYGVKWQDGSVDTLGYGKSHAERLAQEGKLTGVVPDAPFKKNWHELAMKRLLNYAADNGYDSIAITPGAEQANRYPRRNEAEKIAQEQGMSGFYDKMLPDYLNNFGKPYGAQVEMNAQKVDIPRQEIFGDNPIEARTVPLHTFPITPEMRESIKQKGLPLYQQIGIPTAGAASQMPETMQEPEFEPEVKKADGGAINYNTAPDMSDGGRIIQGAPFKRGGKVNISTNRDAMFMELSNKKLKRK